MTMTTDFQSGFVSAMTAVAMLFTLPSHAQRSTSADFPSKSITIVVPYTPTSGADVVARVVGPRMARRLGQPVVVDNRPGASGTIGTGAVVRATADGHTLLMSADTITMIPSLYRKLPFVPAKDLIPVGRAATGTLALVVNPSVPASSVADLIALAKKNPGKYTYASPGIGTPHHVTMELFRQSSGIDLLHVAYKGMAGALTDLVGGQVDAAFVSLNVVMPHISSGRVRLLAIADNNRSSLSPNVPTFREAGFPELSQPSWVGLFAPAGTAPAVVDKLYGALSEALKDPEVQASLQQQGLKVSLAPPVELAKEIQQDLARWKQVITAAGISAE